MRAPMSASRILAEQKHAEDLVLAEHHLAYDAAQSALMTPTKLVDENGVEFKEGQRVVSLTELWRGTKMLVAGMPGRVRVIMATNVALEFEDSPETYWMRRERMKTVLRVVE